MRLHLHTAQHNVVLSITRVQFSKLIVSKRYVYIDAPPFVECTVIYGFFPISQNDVIALD